MSKKFLCEVPRMFSEITAEDLAAAKNKLAEEAGIVARKYAVLEDISGKEYPSAKEASSSDSDTLLNRIVNVFESGKSVTSVTGHTAFLGIGGGDIVFNSSLSHALGIVEEDEIKADVFVSFGGFLADSLKVANDSKNEVKTA